MNVKIVYMKKIHYLPKLFIISKLVVLITLLIKNKYLLHIMNEMKMCQVIERSFIHLQM